MHIPAIIRRYPYAIFYAVDILGSAISFGRPDETISARLGAGRRHGDRVATFLANALDRVVLVIFRRPDHSEMALKAFEARQAAIGEPS